MTYIKNMKKTKMQKPLQPQPITRAELKKADLTTHVPFLLELSENDEPIICEQIVRVIPGKRMVIFGTWHDKNIVIKLFFARGKSQKNLADEIYGIEALTASRIPTPTTIFQGQARDKQIYLLISEKIEESSTLDLLWKNKQNPEELHAILHAVTIELATQHVLGIVQKDLHLKNFLISQNQIYTLDGGSIYFNDGILPKQESLKYLALFFAQLGVGQEELIQKLFETYAQSRGWHIRKYDCDYLNNSLKNWNRTRWQRYQKKIFRNCTAYAKHGGGR